MTTIKAASLALLGVIILASYLIYTHISISWLAANAISPGIAATSEQRTASLPSINASSGQRKVWVCPMHPEIMQDHPGTCPICGMELVESKSHEIHDHDAHVDSASIQKLGVRLASVKKSPVSEEIRVYGNVTADENALYNVHSNFDGWIKKSHIHSIGQHIKKGQVIYEIYSPELIMQQKEYLNFVERRNQILKTMGDVTLQENEYVMDLLAQLSRERTKFLYENIGIDTIQQIEDSRQPVEVVRILAGESGVVTQINAREGSFATPSNTLFTLANISRVWVSATLYPDQASQVKNDDEVSITGSDGRLIKAHLDFLNPVADNNKVSARMEIDNSQLQLRPGSFVDVTIHAQPHKALVVPSSAVLRTGEGNVVMLYRGEGRFLPVYVETGIENGDLIEITDGLQLGAEMAVNGQFLLDSAASMNAAIERMQSHEPLKPNEGTKHLGNMKPGESMEPGNRMESGMHDAK